MTTEEIEDAINRGMRLDSGIHYVKHTLMLGGNKAIRGRVETKLIPREDFVGSTLIWCQSMHAGIPGHENVTNDANEKGLPRGGQIENVMLYGGDINASRSVYGLWIEGAQFTFRHCHVVYFHHGVCVQWGVDNLWSRCVISQNYVNVELRGTADENGEIRNSVTTQHFEYCQFRQAIFAPHVKDPNGKLYSGRGFWARTGQGTTLNGCKFEANACEGLYAGFGVQTPVGNANGHFEKNGTPFFDAGGKLLNINCGFY